METANSGKNRKDFMLLTGVLASAVAAYLVVRLGKKKREERFQNLNSPDINYGFI